MARISASPFRAIMIACLVVQNTISAHAQSDPDAEPGLLYASQTGMPETLWIDETTKSVVDSIRQTDPASLQKTNSLFVELALSSSSPRLSDDNHFKLGAARLSYLTKIGALDAAEELAQLYEWSDPAILSEVETIALLSTRTERYCDGLLAGEYEEIQNGLKVFCLMRAGEYDAAVDAYQDILPFLNEDRSARLASFLDITEDDPMRDRPWSTLPAPFDFVLDESIGRPRGSQKLPPPYTYFSRESGVTARSDLEITEELVVNGALPPSVLFQAYRENSAAESGGAWGRAQIVQTLDSLTQESHEDELLVLLENANTRFSQNDTLQLFANEARAKLSIFDPAEFQKKALTQHFVALAVLGGWSQSDWYELIARNEPETVLAYKVAHPEINVQPNQIFANTPIARVIKSAFFTNDFQPIEAKGFGEAIWMSLVLIDNHADNPEFQVKGAFQTLFVSGLDSNARLIAIAQLLD